MPRAVPSSKGEEYFIGSVAEPASLNGAADVVEVDGLYLRRKSGRGCCLGIRYVDADIVTDKRDKFLDRGHPPVVSPTDAGRVILGPGNALELHGTVGISVGNRPGLEIADLRRREIGHIAYRLAAVVCPVG